MTADSKTKKPGRVGRITRWLFNPGESLSSRTLNAGVWGFALNLSTRMLRTIRTVVIARFLAPADFGLFGIALLALSLLQTFTNTGFRQALIQRKGDVDDYLDAAWTIQLLRGFVLGGGLLLAAPLVAGFFETPQAAAIVRWLAVVMILAGFVNVGVVFFDKELQFRERFVFRSVPQVAELIVSATAAVILRNVWALVIGLVASTLVRLIASYVAHPYRPRFSTDWRKAWELFKFGVWILGSSMLVYLMLNLDDIIVGKVLSPADLGYYQLAYTISALVATQITTVVGQVAFPALSKIQNDLPRLRRAYMRVLLFVSLVVFPFAAGLWFVGPQAVDVFLGRRWLPLIAAYEVLVLWGLIRSLGSTTNSLFQAVGKPYIVTGIQLATVSILAVSAYPLTVSGGIAGAAWATIIASVPFVAGLFIVSRLLALPRSAIPSLLAVPAVATGLMLGVLFLIKGASRVLAGPWLLVWSPVVGAAVYVGAILLARRYLGYAPEGFLPKGGAPGQSTYIDSDDMAE
jgi:O-antigen/teichoic acid export membrane protein